MDIRTLIFAKTHEWEYEKGISDNKFDKGGKTNDGITYNHYNAYCFEVLGRQPTYEHFITMPKADIMEFYVRVWKRMSLDGIGNTLLAGICFDFGFNSGFAKREIQEVLQQLGYKIEADNVFGPKTISCLNDAYKKYGFGLADLILSARLYYVTSLVYKDETQFAFLKGWFNRIMDFRAFVLKYEKSFG